MNEEQKIEKLLEQYKHFFETTSADIATSIKGRRFFYFKDSVCGELYCMTEFATAQELEQILLHEMANELNMSIENSIEVINEKINTTNISYLSCEFGVAIKHLANTFETMYKEFSKYYPTVQSSLHGLSTYINKCEESKKQ